MKLPCISVSLSSCAATLAREGALGRLEAPRVRVPRLRLSLLLDIDLSDFGGRSWLTSRLSYLYSLPAEYVAIGALTGGSLLVDVELAVAIAVEVRKGLFHLLLERLAL